MKTALLFKRLLFFLSVLLLFIIWLNLIVVPLTSYFLRINNLDNLNLFLKLAIEFLIGVIPFALLTLFAVQKIFFYKLDEMVEISKRLSLGDFSKRLDTSTKGPLGSLGENINTIVNNSVSSLQSLVRSLQKTKQDEAILAKNVNELEKARSVSDRALLELREERVKLKDITLKDEAILGSIADAVIAISKEKRIFLFNHAAVSLIGYSAVEATKLNYDQCLKFSSENTTDTIPDFIGGLLNGQRLELPKRIMLVNRAGQKIPIAQSMAPIEDFLGTIQGVVLVLRDVTKERQLDHMKDEFVSVASHELRTPMTAIKGMLSMILEGDYGKFSEELKEPLNDVFVSTNRLIELVNDMLDVSRIEAGRVRISLSTFKMANVVSEISELLTTIATQKGIQLVVGAQSNFTVQADLNKVKQILNNLIGNSLKFTDKGSITITSNVQNQVMRVFVTDTGMGITPDDQKKLFSKFSQISTAQTGKPPGTGLGLYISHQLCQIMGGDMWIERSEIGKGSIFAFSVPLSGSPLAKQTAEIVAKQYST